MGWKIWVTAIFILADIVVGILSQLDIVSALSFWILLGLSVAWAIAAFVMFGIDNWNKTPKQKGKNIIVPTTDQMLKKAKDFLEKTLYVVVENIPPKKGGYESVGEGKKTKIFWYRNKEEGKDKWWDVFLWASNPDIIKFLQDYPEEKAEIALNRFGDDPERKDFTETKKAIDPETGTMVITEKRVSSQPRIVQEKKPSGDFTENSERM